MSFGIFLIAFIVLALFFGAAITLEENKKFGSEAIVIVCGGLTVLYMFAASFMYESVPHFIQAWRHPFSEVICIRSDKTYDGKLIDFNDYVVLHVSSHCGFPEPHSDGYTEYVLMRNHDKNTKVETTYAELLKKGNN